MFETVDAIVLAVVFIIPGFIIDSIMSSKFPSSKRDATFTVFRFIVYSSLNYALLIFLITDCVINYKTISSNYLSIFSLWTVIFQPLVLAIFLCRFGSSKPVSWILGLVGMDLTGLTPSAWDHKFYMLPPKHLIVTLLDGTIIYGLWSSNSFAPQDKDNCDLYLSTCFLIGEDGSWVERTDSDGVLICKNQIKTIEFFGKEEHIDV